MNKGIAALDFTTQCLGVDQRPDVSLALRSQITSGRVPWESVVSLANKHLITSALWVALRERGLVNCLPTDLRVYLQDIHLLNTRRNECLKAQASEAICALNAVDIEPVLLKGGVFLFITPNDPGARILADLDILVPHEHLEACWEELNRLGYRPDTSREHDYYTNHHHRVPLGRPGDYGTIEVHQDLVRRAASRILPTEMALAHAKPLTVDGVAIRVLTPTYRVLHNILHAEIVYPADRGALIELRSLNDVVIISRTYNEQVNWSAIREIMDRHGEGRALRSYLYLVHRLFGMALPGSIEPTLGCLAHYARVRMESRYEWLEAWNRRTIKAINLLYSAARHRGDPILSDN